MTIVQLSIQSKIPIKELTERCSQLHISHKKHISPEDAKRIKAYAPEEQFETLTSKMNEP